MALRLVESQALSSIEQGSMWFLFAASAGKQKCVTDGLVIKFKLRPNVVVRSQSSEGRTGESIPARNDWKEKVLGWK